MSINSIYAGSTPHSRDTIRQQYLNNMSLDIANMTKNLNANRLFKANGSTGSEPADTRTATEKFADIEGLRQSVKTGLRDITDAMEAQNIINDITTPELEFLAQQLPFIIRDLKPKFALGVPAGSFVPYLRRMMRSNIENEGLAYGLTTAPNVAGGVASTGTEYMSPEAIDYKLQSALNDDRNFVGKQSFTGNEREKMKFSALIEKITSIAELSPTPKDRDMVASLNDPDILDNYDEIVAQIGQNLPAENDLDRALQLPTLAQKNKMLSGLLDGVDLAHMREFQEYLDGVRGELYQQNTEAKRQSLLEQRGLESPEDFEERIARENPVGAIPALQVPEGSNYTNFESAKNDILFQTPRAIAPQQQIPTTEQDSPDLPDAYVSKEGVRAVVPPYKDQAIPYNEYVGLRYEDKKRMLLSYANNGLFDDMDAGFHQMINALNDPFLEVPERAMDNEYRKFDKANSLFRTEPNLDRGERGAEDLLFGDIKKRVERGREPEEESGFGWAMEGEDPVRNPTPQPLMGKKAKMNKFMIQERLQRGDYEDYPDFKEVAELIVNTDRVEEEDINNFLTAFIQIKQQEEKEGGQMGAQDVNVAEARQPAVKAVKSKSKPELVEELAGLEQFQQLSIPQKIQQLESLRDSRDIDDIEIIRRVNALAFAQKVKNETLNKIYDDLLISRGQIGTLKELPVSAKKAVKGSAESTEAEGRTPDKGSIISSAKSINAPTEELFATPQKAQKESEVKYPTSVAKFKALNNTTKLAILNKALGDDLFADESVPVEIYEDIKKKEISAKWKDLFAREYVAFYEAIMPVIKERGIGGMGLPVPHHVLGTNGYGIKPQGRPMMQTMGGSLHHTKSAPMGEWGSGLPKNKKKGNIIFGMGLASVVPQPRVKVEGKNINLSAGIEAEPAYVKFGTHLLNKHRLKDNVVMMRTMKGGAIVNIPTQKVSSKLARVLHTISGGGIPQFESVMDLTDGDKALLHQIAKTSKVSDRLSVPNPNKSKLEEEDNRFNILRGEVSIGNDAPAVIKEFKVLLLKFMREGRVPTGQGKAIMEELLLLGY